MKVKHLIDALAQSTNSDQSVVVSVYRNDDSGEQEMFEIDHAAIYTDGSVQLKMSEDITAALGRQLDLELEVKHLRESLALNTTDAMIKRMYELFQNRRDSDEKVALLSETIQKLQKDVKRLKKELGIK
jgi:hypothetical protein